MTRAARRLVSRLLLASLLFTQLAVAAYACPQWFASGGAQPEAMQMAQGDDGCEHLSQATPNLCAVHCQYGLQNIGHADAPAVARAMQSGLFVPSIEAVAPAYRVFARERHGIAPAAPPPHAILHCCFRI